ncbi:MAG: hypothetical protein HUU21_15920 [Polyangiaceae bacterium]|nr:hypothetical protein [Polyangiaceae bacterium]
MNHGSLFSAPITSRVALAAFLAGGLLLTTACNAVTGAGDLRLRDVDEEDEDNNNTTQGAGGAGAGGAGGAGGMATACVYPTAPAEGYGKEMGDIVSNVYKWDGYVEGTIDATESNPISIESYLDCDGSKGINALMIVESAEWCANCQQEASELNTNMANKWEAMGIRVLTLMVEKADTSPADLDTAFTWKSSFNLMSTAVAVDPPITFTPPGASSIGLPLIVVIDPRTMKIVHTQEGYSPSHPELEALAEQNAAASP